MLVDRITKDAMRRRICEFEQELFDGTDRPASYLWTEPEDQPLGALYDEQLWEAYQVALNAVDQLRQRIVGQLRNEPYDADELALAERCKEMYRGPFDSKLYDEIRAQLRANAAKQVSNE